MRETESRIFDAVSRLCYEAQSNLLPRYNIPLLNFGFSADCKSSSVGSLCDEEFSAESRILLTHKRMMHLEWIVGATIESFSVINPELRQGSCHSIILAVFQNGETRAVKSIGDEILSYRHDGSVNYSAFVDDVNELVSACLTDFEQFILSGNLSEVLNSAMTGAFISGHSIKE